MSKVNYAKIRNSQKRADTNPEDKAFEPPSPLEAQSSTSGSLVFGDRTPYPNVSSKIESSGLTNLFGENVLMDNLDYINSLLGNQLPGGSALPQKRKKNKQKIDDASTQPRSSDKVISSTSPQKLNEPLNVPLNSPGLDPSSSLLNPYEIEKDIQEDKDSKKEDVEWRGARNMSNMISRKEVEMYEEYFQGETNNEIGKRSMSLEDIRIPKRDFSKANGLVANNRVVATDGEMFADESIQITTDPTPGSIMQETGNSKPSKNDFSSKLGQYINYFQKSENSHARIRKASQYSASTSGQPNSRTESQRSGQSKNSEFEKMASQIKKLKTKLSDMQLTNELLSNERKTWRKKEHELLSRVELAESELEKTQSKAKKYKEKLKYTQELLQREKLDNENNLLALRRVLANNISTVLEHKIHHYMKTEKDQPYKEQSKQSVSDKGGVNRKHGNQEKGYRKDSNHVHTLHTHENQGNEARYEIKNGKNSWKNTSLKTKMSPLLSQKDQSFSEDEENPPERLTTLSKSDELDIEEALNKKRRFPRYSPRQSEFETSSELGEDFQYYFYGTQHDPSKKLQQIQHLQNQLSKLMEKEESLSHSTSHYTKTSQKNGENYSANKQRSHQNSSYSLKGRDGNHSKMTSFSKQHEQQTRLYRKDLDDTLSPNEGFNNPSFSNSESGWTTCLGK